MNLSPNQQEIVNHVDGALLVKAGPGSGKTRVLTERVKHLLSIKKRGKILALTFSNMAAEEMRTRLVNDPMVGDSIERVTISTIHSFCIELVQARGHYVGLRPDIAPFESDDDRIAILRDVILNDPEWASMIKRQEKPNQFLSNFLMAISEQKRGLILPETSEEIEPFPSIYRKFNDALSSQNAMDFDDILCYAYRILTENADVAQLYTSVYRYICVDEAQDLNEAQYRVLQALCNDGFQNLMMVGDENQSIYAFNGSSSKYMSQYFVNDFSPQIYLLNENFRSAKQIIEYANSLAMSHEDASKYYYDGELLIKCYENEGDEARSVRCSIEGLKKNGHKDIEGEVTFEKIAVIARNKYVFSNLETELVEAKIPYYIKRTRAGMDCETSYMKAFDLILRLIANPMDLYHKQLLCKLTEYTRTNISNNEMSKTSATDVLTGSGFEWLTSIVESITPNDHLNFDNVLRSLKSNIPTALSDDDKYLLEKDIDEWANHWLRFKARVPNEGRTLISFRNAIALGRTQSMDSDTGVALLTAHMSKGLEFEAVFVIGLSEGTFPDYRAVRNGGDAISQEKNNMYVAATRAKRLCYLSYPQEKKMPWGDVKPQQASRFIANYQKD